MKSELHYNYKNSLYSSPKVACSCDGTCDFFGCSPVSNALSLPLADAIEGDSLILSISHDMLSTNETNEKENLTIGM